MLQSDDKQKYGYIDGQVMGKTLKGNIKIIENTYGGKVAQRDGKTMEIVSEVEKELDVKIFNSKTKSLDNLDNVDVLLRLQDKIDKF